MANSSIASDRTSRYATGRPSRRTILTGAAGGAIAALSPASANPAGASSRRDRRDYDVIIIGAGFAGLTAARELKRAGLHILLLEARNRIGGRTFTSEFAGHPADLGGTWVHWIQPHIWAEISRYGLEIEETPAAVADDLICLDYRGERREAKASRLWPEIDAAVRTLMEDARQTMPRPAEPFVDDNWVKADRFSVAQKLASLHSAPDSKAMVDTLFTLFGASMPDQAAWIDIMRFYALSGYDLAMLNDATARYKIKGGMNRLSSAIAADCGADIRLDSPVAAIRDLPAGAEVTTAAGDRHTASAVISTIPLNVLKDVRFTPPLPAGKLDTSRTSHAGKMSKIHVLLDKPYPMFTGWAPGSGSSQINFLLWDGIYGGHTHLIAFATRERGVDGADAAAVQHAIRAFLPDANVLDIMAHDWNADPFSQGVWCISRPGQISGALRSLQAHQGRIFFASADWANGWRGAIDGAVEQGLIAARAVTEMLAAKG